MDVQVVHMPHSSAPVSLGVSGSGEDDR